MFYFTSNHGLRLQKGIAKTSSEILRGEKVSKHATDWGAHRQDY